MPTGINVEGRPQLAQRLGCLSRHRLVQSPRPDACCVRSAVNICSSQGSHGTHEFYTERAHITKQLFLTGGFNAVILESDFPDAFKVGSPPVARTQPLSIGLGSGCFPCSACEMAASMLRCQLATVAEWTRADRSTCGCAASRKARSTMRSTASRSAAAAIPVAEPHQLG